MSPRTTSRSLRHTSDTQHASRFDLCEIAHRIIAFFRHHHAQDSVNTAPENDLVLLTSVLRLQFGATQTEVMRKIGSSGRIQGNASVITTCCSEEVEVLVEVAFRSKASWGSFLIAGEDRSQSAAASGPNHRGGLPASTSSPTNWCWRFQKA